MRCAIGVLLAACAAGLVVACGGGSAGGKGHPPDTTAAQLASLKAYGIYFGHQSVGQNIMAGVDDLLAEVPAADRLERGGIADAGTGTWADGGVGSNGDPLGKLADFASQMEGLCGKVDIAFMKFCWADTPYVDAHGPQALLDAYVSTMAAVHGACPSATLVHLTLPLTTSGNGSREAYNALLRAHYGAAVFDVAREESTRPDGSRSVDGDGLPVLFADYAADSGHLNTTGRDRVAAKLVAFLAGI
jgi:hypothetical protein